MWSHITTPASSTPADTPTNVIISSLQKTQDWLLVQSFFLAPPEKKNKNQLVPLLGLKTPCWGYGGGGWNSIQYSRSIAFSEDSLEPRL